MRPDRRVLPGPDDGDDSDHRRVRRRSSCPELIRPGRDEDADRFIALIARCWAEYPNCPLDVDRDGPELRALATYYQGRGGALWIADDPAGMIATAPLEGGTWEICRVYVHPDGHGGGLGPALLAAAERHAIGHGARELVLWSDTRFRRAHAFYGKHGYVRHGELRPFEPGGLEFGFAKTVRGVRRLDVAAAGSAEGGLAAILCACVEGGASVSFLRPLEMGKARRFWREVTAAVGQGRTILLGGWDDGRLLGTIQVQLHASELGRHRAEIAKFLVHPEGRGRGLGTALLRGAEAAAREAGRSLLLLDTRAGDDGERLYRSEGWAEVGRIEDYTRDAAGCAAATVLFAKRV